MTNDVLSILLRERLLATIFLNNNYLWAGTKKCFPWYVAWLFSGGNEAICKNVLVNCIPKISMNNIILWKFNGKIL